MKRLYLIVQSYYENKGSFYAFTEDVARLYNGKGYGVHIVCAKNNKQDRSYEELPYAKVHRFTLSGFPAFNTIFREIQFAQRLKRFFKDMPETEEDIIIANGFTPLGIPGKKYVVRAPDQPAFTLLKNLEIAKNQVSIVTRAARFFHFLGCYFLDRKVMDNASGILYSSNENRKENNRYYRTEKIPFIIPNKAVDFSKIKGSNLKLKGRNILFIARSDERIRKGIYYLEKALPAVFDRFPDVSIIHLGDATAWKIDDRYRNRIISLGKMPQDRMKDYYASVDFLVHCSLSEGIPAVLMEAMAAGTPVISSDIQGISEFIRHKESGYIFRRGDAESLKNGLIHMLEDKTRLQKYSRNAKIKAGCFESKIYYSALYDFVNDIKDRKHLKKDLLA